MQDTFGREINYLRISLTDLCNLRCVYCMPEEGIEQKLSHTDILSFEEILEITREAAKLGIRKVRITGGEPLVRRGMVKLCRELRAIPEIEDLSITTNGILLPRMAGELKEAGVTRLNISLDTLNAEKYQRITRCGNLEDALNGIRAAMEAGFEPIKINTVLIGGFNDDEIPLLAGITKKYPVHVRFIELMPIGHAQQFGPEAYIPCDTVLKKLPALEAVGEISGVAEVYRFPGAPGTVGLISPLSNCFCPSCNRIRLTADGYLKPCLHSKEEIPVRGLHGEDLRRCLETAIYGKPQEHGALSAEERSRSKRDMNQIGG